MQKRIIIHLDMDCFFAQVEERESPQFKGKPVVVGADPKEGKGRGVVSTANYKAREYGIHSAMPISEAWRLCPRAVFLPPNFELYSRTSERIMRIIEYVLESYSPNHSTIVERVSLDEAYIDMSRNLTIVNKTSEKDAWERAEKVAEDMRKEIFKQEQLTCSCGVGPNKMIAKIACEDAKPNGIKTVRAEDAEKFIENMDVQKIPGIGLKTAEILRGSGVRIVLDLKQLKEHDMADLFGVRGMSMYWRSRGIDDEPVVAEREVKSVGKEVTFAVDTRDPELLVRTFEQMAHQVGKEIEDQELRFKTITVVCRFTGFETHTKAKTLKEATTDTAILRREAMKLFLRFLVERQKPVRLLGVRAMV